MNGEEQNTDIRNKLLNLQRVKASRDFENNLLRKLNAIETDKVKPEVKKTGLLDFIFGKKTLVWAVPAGSLAVLLIVYFTLIRNDSIKDTTALQNGKPQEQTIPGEQNNTMNTESGKSEIPGKDLVNDLEIGKTDSKEKDKTLQKGFIETVPETRTEKPAPETGRTKPENKEAEEEVKTFDAIKSEAPKKTETPKTETPKKNEAKEMVPVKPAEKETKDDSNLKKEERNDATKKNDKVKDEKGKEETGKTLLPEKKITSPMIDDSKKKTGKDSTKKDESKSKKPELSKELLEELKKKINDNQ